jgi:hypothetical protein
LGGGSLDFKTHTPHYVIEVVDDENDIKKIRFYLLYVE